MMVVGVSLYSDSGKESRMLEIAIVPDKGRFYFVFNKDELVSYGGVWFGRFYLNHLGKEVKGRVEGSERFRIRKSSGELEIGINRDFFGLGLHYIPFGSRLTPLIQVKTQDWECLMFPELNKIYRGEEVNLIEQSWGFLVENNKSSEQLYVYMLMLDGKERLVYKGSAFDFRYIYSPSISKVENTLIVELEKVNKDIKRYFLLTPEYSYLFVCKENGKIHISFDLENWMTVKANEMIYKKSTHEHRLYCIYSSHSSDKSLEEVLWEALNEYYSSRDRLDACWRIKREDVLSYGLDGALQRALEEFEKDRPNRVDKDIRLIQGKLPKAWEEIKSKLLNDHNSIRQVMIDHNKFLQTFKFHD